MKPVGILVLEAAGRGCRSCVAPSKQRLIKTRGARGVHARGWRAVVIYGPLATTGRSVVREGSVENYYKVRIVMNRIVEARARVLDTVQHIHIYSG